MSNKPKSTWEEKTGMVKVSFRIYTIHVQGYGFFSCGDFPLISWRWSPRGHGRLLTLDLDPGKQRLLTPSLFLEYTLHSVHGFHRSHFKDTALSERCVVETIWMLYVTDIFKNLVGRCKELLGLWSSRQASHFLFPCV